MTDLVQSAALVCSLLGLAAAGAVLLGLRDVRAATGVLLEFLLAAGLLRLSADPTWGALLVAAAVVALRRLLVVALGRSTRTG